MTHDQLNDICLQVIALVKETGAFIKEQLDDQHVVEFFEKGIHDFVTRIDKESEEKLIAGLAEILPGSGFLTEENTIQNEFRKYTWIIDPLDGTTNFIHSIPVYSISVALLSEQEIIIGVVYEINMDECFYAWQNSKAFMNGREISVSSIADLNHALIATGFPYYDYSRMEPYMNLFAYLVKNSAGVRRLGSAAVDLCYVACGRFEGFYEYGLNPWDVAAGAFIVQQADGYVCDFNGENNYIYGAEIVATNQGIKDTFIQMIKRFFTDPKKQIIP